MVLEILSSLYASHSKLEVPRIGSHSIRGIVGLHMDLYLRGIPLYLAPETVIESIKELPSDIWVGLGWLG